MAPNRENQSFHDDTLGSQPFDDFEPNRIDRCRRHGLG